MLGGSMALRKWYECIGSGRLAIDVEPRSDRVLSTVLRLI